MPAICETIGWAPLVASFEPVATQTPGFFGKVGPFSIRDILRGGLTICPTYLRRQLLAAAVFLFAHPPRALLVLPPHRRQEWQNSEFLQESLLRLGAQCGAFVDE